ncbi:MAG: beta-lactamase family protein, partial [Phycisphaerales bacterium]|nr:beta-lactamase family protein [Phycisphaerales bacterium]
MHRASIIGAIVASSFVAAAQVERSTFDAATPEAVGLDGAALEALAAAAGDYVDRDLLVGGELLVIKDGHTVLHRTFGERDAEDGVPWEIGAICNIRSMTKPLTGAAIQICADRGLLSLDDTVATYIDTFDTDPLRAVTIDQVMSHRAGLPLTLFDTDQDLGRFGSLIGQAKAIGERGPQFEPGSKFWYSDAGSDVLGAIVETVTGTTLDAFWTTEIFGPLGMHDTFVPLDKEDPRFARLASLHIASPDGWQRYWDPSKPSFYPYAWGSQSVFSTPADYAAFLWTWMHGGTGHDGTRVLSARAVESTLEPQTGMRMLGSDQPFPTGFPEVEPYYGRMAQLWISSDDESVEIVGHTGSDGTAAWAWPERDLMILFFTQSRGSAAVLRFEEQIDRLLLHPDRAEAPVPDEFRPYLGTYIANFASFRNESFRVL